MRRNVRLEVQKQLLSGAVLSCEKTRMLIGKRTITVGKYHEAVPTGKSYAMFTDKKGGGGESFYFSTALEAAQAFVDYVGRNMAWDSLPPAVKNRR